MQLSRASVQKAYKQIRYHIFERVYILKSVCTITLYIHQTKVNVSDFFALYLPSVSVDFHMEGPAVQRRERKG